MYLKRQLHFKPKPPGYIKGSKWFKVAYPNSRVLRPKLVGNQLLFSLGLTVKRWLGISELFLPMPSNLDFSKVKEFTIIPKNGAFYLEISYEVELQQHDLNNNQVLYIDCLLILRWRHPRIYLAFPLLLESLILLNTSL